MFASTSIKTLLAQWIALFPYKTMGGLRHTAELHLRINRSRIHFLKFILEAYDGLALLSVVEPRHGLVLIRFAPESAGDIAALLSSLAAQGSLK